MPLFRFVCTPCQREEKTLMTKEQADKFSGACQLCGSPLTLTLGVPEAQSMETADDYRGKKVMTDVEKKLDQRAQDYFNKHDLPRLRAEKGDDWCKQNGFLDAEGRPK